MQSFTADIDQLRQAMVDVVGAAGVRVLAFARDPNLVTGPLTVLGADSDGEPIPVAELPVRVGARVLVVTDLGIVVPRRGPTTVAPERLRACARTLRRIGVEPLFVTPFPSPRWPAGIDRLPLVMWDEHLRARTVRHVVERNLRR